MKQLLLSRREDFLQTHPNAHRRNSFRKRSMYCVQALLPPGEEKPEQRFDGDSDNAGQRVDQEHYPQAGYAAGDIDHPGNLKPGPPRRITA